MPTKAELYAQMADKVATQLTGSWQEWAGFLTTASRLYKYPFHEQLMIYAQRPDATACAEYDLWNEKMGRYVRRGSKGIALVDDSGDRPRLRYVFDISDTGTREHSRTPWLWQLEERHLDSVQAMLEHTYDVSGDDLAGQLTEVAGKLAEEYWTEHQQDFFAVLTGCLRVSKESIFTGLNNFEINSIVDIAHDEQFGFTDDEVRKLLLDYDRSERYPDVKEWYDGYHFGNTDIYCPWDVINFAKKLVWDPSARPSAFWINSSGNDMVKRFVDKADQTTRDEIEKLVAGGFVEKQLRLDLTYDEIDNTIDNLWSVLFTTGYLTKAGEVRMPDSGSYAYKLVIPNKEVREVFVLQIQEWFKAVVAKDDDTMKLLSRAILDKDEKQIARQLNIVMSRMISILDTKASDDMKENFYHGLLLGLLRGSNPGWLIKSNRESGDGFSDILIKPEDPDAGIVIEVKYAKEMISLDAACEAAMAQIKEKRYDEALRDEGRCDILAYGIAFCRKRCRVVGENIND